MKRPPGLESMHVLVFSPEQNPDVDEPYRVGRPIWVESDLGLTIVDDSTETREYIPEYLLGVVRERPLMLNSDDAELTKKCEVCGAEISAITEATVDLFHIGGKEGAPLWLISCNLHHGSAYWVDANRLEEQWPKYCWTAHLSEKVGSVPNLFIDAVKRLNGLNKFDSWAWEEEERRIYAEIARS